MATCRFGKKVLSARCILALLAYFCAKATNATNGQTRATPRRQQSQPVVEGTSREVAKRICTLPLDFVQAGMGLLQELENGLQPIQVECLQPSVIHLLRELPHHLHPSQEVQRLDEVYGKNYQGETLTSLSIQSRHGEPDEQE